MVSSAASALFVISANAWMNQPDGFDLVDGKVTNVHVLRRDVQRRDALRGVPRHDGRLTSRRASRLPASTPSRCCGAIAPTYNRRALLLTLAVGAVAIPLQIVSGDFSARFVADKQPAKFAAMEGQYETETGRAPAYRRHSRTRRRARRTTRSRSRSSAASWPIATSMPRCWASNAFPTDEQPDARLVHLPFQVDGGRRLLHAVRGGRLLRPGGC